MSDSVPLEQDLPALERSAVTTNLGELVNVSNESVQALDTEIMITMPYGSTAGFISQQVTKLGARSHAHHQQNLSLLPSSSQLPVIDSVSAAISSLAGADNNTRTITTQYDGSNRSEEVINLDKNLHVENYQQDLPSLQNSSNPAVINSVASAIASLASGPVFPDMALQQVPRSFGANMTQMKLPEMKSKHIRSPISPLMVFDLRIINLSQVWAMAASLRCRSVITIMMIGIMVPFDDMPVEFGY